MADVRRVKLRPFDNILMETLLPVVISKRIFVDASQQRRVSEWPVSSSSLIVPASFNAKSRGPQMRFSISHLSYP